MVMAMILFNLNLDPLFRAIAQVESDNGLTSPNVYQITSVYVRDMQRVYPTMKFIQMDVYDREQSKTMMFCYWKHYGYKFCVDTGSMIDYEVLAKMHHLGGRYFKKRDKETIEQGEIYWRKVKGVMEAMK